MIPSGGVDKKGASDWMLPLLWIVCRRDACGSGFAGGTPAVPRGVLFLCGGFLVGFEEGLLRYAYEHCFCVVYAKGYPCNHHMRLYRQNPLFSFYAIAKWRRRRAVRTLVPQHWCGLPPPFRGRFPCQSSIANILWFLAKARFQ